MILSSDWQTLFQQIMTSFYFSIILYGVNRISSASKCFQLHKKFIKKLEEICFYPFSGCFKVLQAAQTDFYDN